MGGHGSRPAPNQTSTSLHAERLPERSRLARLKEAATEAAAGCESRALEIVENKHFRDAWRRRTMGREQTSSASESRARQFRGS